MTRFPRFVSSASHFPIISFWISRIWASDFSKKKYIRNIFFFPLIRFDLKARWKKKKRKNEKEAKSSSAIWQLVKRITVQTDEYGDGGGTCDGSSRRINRFSLENIRANSHGIISLVPAKAKRKEKNLCVSMLKPRPSSPSLSLFLYSPSPKIKGERTSLSRSTRTAHFSCLSIPPFVVKYE